MMTSLPKSTVRKDQISGPLVTTVHIGVKMGLVAIKRGRGGSVWVGGSRSSGAIEWAPQWLLTYCCPGDHHYVCVVEFCKMPFFWTLFLWGCGSPLINLILSLSPYLPTNALAQAQILHCSKHCSLLYLITKKLHAIKI